MRYASLFIALLLGCVAKPPPAPEGTDLTDSGAPAVSRAPTPPPAPPPVMNLGRGRAVPICAVQDCVTGKMIDDGCSDDGRCMSCVNMCAPPPPPRR